MGKNDLKNKYKITKHYNHFVKHFIPVDLAFRLNAFPTRW